MKYFNNIMICVFLLLHTLNTANAQALPAGVVFQNNIAINHHKPEIQIAYRYCHLGTGYCSLPQVTQPIADKPFHVPNPASTVFSHVVVESAMLLKDKKIVHRYDWNSCKRKIHDPVLQYLNFSMTKGKTQINCY